MTIFKLTLILCLFLIPFSLIPSAFAPSIAFQVGSYTLNDGTPTSPIIITVTDSAANLDSSLLNTVSITVTTTTDPLVKTLILTETGTNTGIFQNTNLVLTTGKGEFTTSDNVIVSITDSSQNIDPFALDTTSVTVTSSSDSTGITLPLSETDINSGIFDGTLGFTSGPSSGNLIKAVPGNIVSVSYLATGEVESFLIIPNPNPGIVTLKADGGDTISATYQSMSDFASIPSSGSGSGTGGPVRPSLVVDVKGGAGSQCSDCTPPTLGVSTSGQRLVENGFSYNGNSVNVELYYTPYPLITAQVGEKNIAKLKIFEDSGYHNIRHVELGFGLGSDQIISESKAVIEYDIDFDGTTKTNLFDPYKVLDNVTITSMPSPCKFGDQEHNCLEVSFYHTFRESLEFNMVGSNVWDNKRNGWQNYYNHGIEVKGDSLNPPKQIEALDRVGHKKTITIINRTLGYDEDGKLWHKVNDLWGTEYIPQERDDPITKHGIDRNNNKFSQYLEDQILLAQNTFSKITNGKQIQNLSFGLNNNVQIIPNVQSRTENPELQESIIFEMKKAEDLRSSLWPELILKWNS